MAENLVNTKNVVNGYFYSFDYAPKTAKKGYDLSPLVFVIEPSTRNLNNFVAINLHHLPKDLREHFIVEFQRQYDFMNVGRVVLTMEQTSNLLNGVSIALREYSKENITNCVRIESAAVPKYINTSSHLLQESEDDTLVNWMLNQNIYKTK